MGYNPTAWHTRRIEDLWLDIDVLRENGFRITMELEPSGKVSKPVLDLPEWLGECEIELSEADIEGGSVLVSKFTCDHLHRDDYEKLQEILSFSVGTLEYVLVWESGDSVEIVTYEDGVIEIERVV
jgi:hypothetical protein